MKRFESVRTPEEAESIMKEAIDESKKLVQEMIDETLKRGLDCKNLPSPCLVPEELVEKMKQGNVGRDFKIEQKMTLREKQKARRKAEDEEERVFFE